MIWEYRVEIAPVTMTVDSLQQMLNELGKCGWELCTIAYGTLVFKRVVS